jgi:peptide/nickel transport system substrate-binding protein
VLLGAPLLSKGTWNSAHFRNQKYDALVKDYVAALDLQSQRRAAKKIQELLLDEVPILFTYFYYYLSGAKDYVAGVETTAMGHIDLSRAGLVA